MGAVEQQTFTPSEAAFVSGLPVRAIQKAIDEGPLARGRKTKGRTLTEPDLLYLATIKAFDPRLVKLTGRAKDKLRRSIVVCWQGRKTGANGMSFAGWLVDFRAVAANVRSSLSKLERARRMVVRDPGIRAG